ncbi:hypothetical protein [Agrococcus sp. Marseille-P2731]|uniref:hypothetical protein n=1 Tax=Agrococcus sp. Marseille-P2731 TaxID=1841862 RepID=UPI001160D609|nr:hypothetical protein [Agrococcus sp. Marseille-P2731]
MRDDHRPDQHDQLDELLRDAAPLPRIAQLTADASALARGTAVGQTPRRRRRPSRPLVLGSIAALGLTAGAAVATTIVLGTPSSPDPTAVVAFEYTDADAELQRCDGSIWVLPTTTVQTVEDPVGGWQRVMPEMGGVTYRAGTDQEFRGSGFSHDTLLGGDRMPVEPLEYDQTEFEAVRDLVLGLPSAELLADDMATLDVESSAWTDSITDAVIAAGYGDSESARLVVTVGCLRP